MSPSPDDRSPTRWPVVAVAILAGVAAALHVGKVPPALPAVRDDLGLGLVGAGWVASILNLVGATLGLASGLFADRIGARGSLIAGLALLALGAVAGALAGSAAALLAARALSGVGLLVVAVSAPRIVVAVSEPADHGLALGAWSVYMPVGMALAMASAPLVLPVLGWRGLWLVHAGVTLAVLAIALVATRRVEPRAATALGLGAQALRRPGPWLLAAAFACYTIQWFALMTWLPTFLVESRGVTRETAAVHGAFVVGCNALGAAAGAWLLHRAVARWILLAAAYVAMAACAIGIFTGLAPGFEVALAAAFSLAGGLLPAAVLGGAAAHAPRREHVATVNGLIVQGSNLGTVLGPPVLAALVAGLGGWRYGWTPMAVFGTAGLGIALALRAVERR